MRTASMLGALLVAAAPAAAAAQTSAWSPELAVSAGLGHVFRWDDQTFGDRVNAGAGVAVAHPSGWVVELQADRTFNLVPRQAPCGVVGVTCVGIGHDGPRSMTVASLVAHYRFRGKWLQPYLIGGLGVMWSRSAHSETRVQGATATISEFESRDRGFGPQLGVGARVPLGRHWSVNPELRWLDAPWLSGENLAVTRVVLTLVYAVRPSPSPERRRAPP
jgi:hypothetical protein